MRVSVNSACVISPPVDSWPAIEALYSPKFVWPFVTQNHFEEGIKLLQANRVFQSMHPFQSMFMRYLFLIPDVILPEVAAPTKKEKNKHKKELPPNPIVTLRNIICTTFPTASAENKQVFDPHLSIGQFDQQKISEVKQSFEKNWEPIQFEVNELLFITRDGPNDTWRIHTRVKLPM